MMIWGCLLSLQERLYMGYDMIRQISLHGATGLAPFGADPTVSTEHATNSV